MPRHAKGARLYLKVGRKDYRSGRTLPSIWFIRDGSLDKSTGCLEHELAGPQGAEAQLAAYIAAKHAAAPAPDFDKRNPAEVLVADALAFYVDGHGERGMDAATFDGMVKMLGERMGAKSLADVRRSTCQAYVARRIEDPDRRYKDPDTAPRVSSETARRELEILGAAIGWWDGEHKLTSRPTVWLPDKPESQRDALTRSQAAALLKAAMGYRLIEEDGKAPRWERLGLSARANRAHLRRFILIGLYSGSRPSVTTDGLWVESPTSPWVDVDRGMIWRRGKAERDKETKRRPVVKLPGRLKAHLRRWKAMDAKRKDLTTNAVIHHGGEALAGKIRTGFEGVVRDAGLPPEITPHWLRHTCATWLMEAGVDMWDAAAYTGMTVKVLEDHYAHHRPDYQAAARGALGGRRQS